MPLIAHSHGGQVALYAAAKGLRIPALVTVGTPVRADMQPIAEAALPQIGKWLHISDARWDWWGQIGAFGDGAISLTRTMPFPSCVNAQLRGIAHTKVLNDPSKFPLWETNGWLEYLR